MITRDELDRFVQLLKSRHYKVATRRTKFPIYYDDIFVDAQIDNATLVLRTQAGHIREVALAELSRIDFLTADCVRAMYLVACLVEIRGNWYEDGTQEQDAFLLVPA